jgi:hypothetical protein
MTGTVAGRCNVQGRDEGENVLTESPEFLSLETCYFLTFPTDDDKRIVQHRTIVLIIKKLNYTRDNCFNKKGIE